MTFLLQGVGHCEPKALGVATWTLSTRSCFARSFGAGPQMELSHGCLLCLQKDAQNLFFFACNHGKRTFLLIIQIRIWMLVLTSDIWIWWKTTFVSLTYPYTLPHSNHVFFCCRFRCVSLRRIRVENKARRGRRWISLGCSLGTVDGSEIQQSPPFGWFLNPCKFVG